MPPVLGGRTLAEGALNAWRGFATLSSSARYLSRMQDCLKTNQPKHLRSHVTADKLRRSHSGFAVSCFSSSTHISERVRDFEGASTVDEMLSIVATHVYMVLGEAIPESTVAMCNALAALVEFTC